MFNFLSKIKLGRFSSVIPSSLQLSSTSYQAAVLFPISSRDHLSSSEEVLLVFFLFPPSLLLSRKHLKCQQWIRNPRLVGSFCTSLFCQIGPADLDLLGIHIPSNRAKSLCLPGMTPDVIKCTWYTSIQHVGKCMQPAPSCWEQCPQLTSWLMRLLWGR